MKKSAFDISQQQNDLSGKIVASLERLGEAFRVLLWEHAKRLELSPIQIQLMIFVAYHDDALCNVSHLAREFNVTKPTISDAVRVLDKKELIEKVPSPTDKRAYSISLTHSGKQIVEQTAHFASPIRRELDRQFDQSQKEQLFASLSQLMYGLNRAGILSVQRTCYGCRHFSQTEGESGAYCKLMELSLSTAGIRIDCPEFEIG